MCSFVSQVLKNRTAAAVQSFSFVFRPVVEWSFWHVTHDKVLLQLSIQMTPAGSKIQKLSVAITSFQCFGLSSFSFRWTGIAMTGKRRKVQKYKRTFAAVHCFSVVFRPVVEWSFWHVLCCSIKLAASWFVFLLWSMDRGACLALSPYIGPIVQLWP